MAERPDATNGRLRRLKKSSETEKRTLLPRIEPLRRSDNRDGIGGVRRTSLNGAGNAPRSQEKNHARHSQWEIRRNRTSGTINHLQFDTITFPIKSQTSQLSATDKDNDAPMISDMAIETREEWKPLGKSKAKQSRNSTKLSMEPLQFPAVNLKSPVLDLSSSRPAQNDSTTSQTSNKSWEPFSCACKHCGLKFGKHSIMIHEKKCSSKQQGQTLRVQSDDEVEVSDPIPSVTRPQPVARIITIGLESSPNDELTIFASLPPRPETQTLRYSSLRDSGYGLPYVPSVSDSQRSEHSLSSEVNNGTGKHEMTLCDRCGRVIATDRVKVHNRLCKPETHGQVKTSSVKFPSACNLLKVEKSNRVPKTSLKKPPTVVCYICGREYGTKSISIHEPQCLKRFETENQKLPINKRKPLPKKLVEDRTKVARFVSVEDEMVVISAPSADHHPYKDLVDETMDFIFQQCYSDFERELVPCKRCGRRFAPDRHEIHEPKCNAKPLHSKK